MRGTIDQCMEDLFSNSNALLTDKGVTYNTVASWRHQFGLGKLSIEKKREILNLYGYELQAQEKWKRVSQL